MNRKVLALAAILAVACGCRTSTNKSGAPAKTPEAPSHAAVLPPEPVIPANPYFDSDVMPVIDRLGCSVAECHGTAVGRGGLKLSMFGGQPQADFTALVKDAAHKWVKPGDAAASTLPQALTDRPRHKERLKLTPESREIRLLNAWIAQGAKWKDDQAPRIVSLRLSPDRVVLGLHQSQRLRVDAVFSDGSRKDVTWDAVCRCQEARVAQSQPPCQVTALDYGDSAVVVSYRRLWAVGRVLAPRPQRPDYSSFKPLNKIDELVQADLAELNIEPSATCTDSEFLRRAYLDVIGLLPTPAEAQAFGSDSDAQKRAKLIDGLMSRPEFVDRCALKWGDLLRIKSEYPINLWPNAVQAYSRWVHDCLARNVPYDQFVREMLTATGSNFRCGPANYYRAVSRKDPQTVAEATALLLMGTRLECARCHVHPTENWTPQDNLAMAAFFGQVQYKSTQEWKEEIVYVNRYQFLRDQATKKPVTPKFLEGATLDPGKIADLREPFARWLTSPDNPWFARAAVNRIWFWLMGRGIIQEPDDIRATNPPCNPKLLEYLQGELVSHHYDLRHIYRLVLTSRTYQLSSRTRPSNENDTVHFSHRLTQRLAAEQLMDAIGQVTETSEPFTSQIPEPYTVLPEGFRAGQLFDGSISTMFLEMFGRPMRDTAFESQRDDQPSMRQAMLLLNSQFVESKLARSPRLARLAARKDAEIVEELYLAAFSRLPADAERTKALAFLAASKKSRSQAIQDLLWALLNTKEFLFNH